MTAHILQRLPFASGTPVAIFWKRLRTFFSRSVPGIGPISVRLGAGQDLRLQDAAGWTVACSRGSVWLTQEADTRDVFLDGGERFALDRPGLALVLAREESLVAIRPPAQGSRDAVRPRAAPEPAADSAREVWLKAVYPECGPWNDPAAYRKSGLL